MSGKVVGIGLVKELQGKRYIHCISVQGSYSKVPTPVPEETPGNKWCLIPFVAVGTTRVGGTGGRVKS